MENSIITNTLIKKPTLLRELGHKMHSELKLDIPEISEQSCINYLTKLISDSESNTNFPEIKPIYWQVQQLLNIKLEPAPDEWDRLFNVDFYIKIGEKFIGLQIKSVNSGIQLPEIFKEYNLQEETHKKFTEVFGGKVFYLFSAKVGDKKQIQNKEVIEEIKEEISRLQKLA